MSDAEYPREPAPPPVLRRNYTGWVCLALLFALLIPLSFLSQDQKRSEDNDPSKYAIEIKGALAEKAAADSIAKTGLTTTAVDKSKDALTDTLNGVAPTRFTDVTSALIYGVVSYELNKPIAEKDLAILEKKGTPNQRKVYTIFASKSLTAEQAQSLTQGMPSDSFFRKLVIADAFAKSGNLAPKDKLLNGLQTSSKLEILLFGLVIAGGGLSWTVFFLLKASGNAKPLGLPNTAVNAVDADRWAAKSFLFFAAYIALGGVAEAMGVRSPVLAIVGGVIMVAAFFYAFRLRAGGAPITFESMGMGRGSPWLSYVWLGAMGFAMEFPAAMGLGALGEKIFSHQTFTHPAEMELVASHNVLQVISLFLLASVLAPFYEEMIFRGTMLPAVAKFTGVVPSILITSLLFASLHPQGVGAWLGLATVGAGSCVLVYHTKSIVPSFVLHALHNGVTLCFVLLLS